MWSGFWLLPEFPDLWPAPATPDASGSRLSSSEICVHLAPKDSPVTSVGCKQMLNFIVMFVNQQSH